MVYGGGDSKVALLMKILLPLHAQYLFVEFAWRLSFEFLDKKKDPVPCAQKKVECQGIIESAFCLNARGCFG